MKTRSNMPLFVLECSDVKALSNSQIDLLRCGDYLVKKDASGEHAYKVTFKSDTGMCITYFDASVIETQSYDKIDGVWTYNSEDKTPNLLDIPMKMEDIVDKDGHNRFIEGEGSTATLEGLTFSFCKWSLSGTHIMFVCAGAVADTTVIANATVLAYFEPPQWVYDKIVPIFSGTGVDRKITKAFGNDFSSQDLETYLDHKTNKLYITKTGALTLNKDRTFRIQYDLLIDDE